MSGGLAIRPDQNTDPPPMVVAPGGNAGVFKGRLVVIFGTSANGSTGLFVYSGSPALGNLVGSIASVAGTDPYGNAYLAGLTGYFIQSPALVQSQQGSAAASTLTLNLPHATVAGNTLIVAVVTVGTSNNPSVSGITIGGSADNFASVASNGGGTDECIIQTWADVSCVGGQTAVVISTSGGVGTQGVFAVAMEWQNTVGFDVAASQIGVNTGFTFDSTATAAPAVPVEVQIGLVGTNGGAGLTGPGSPWTNFTQINRTIGGILQTMLAGYRVVLTSTVGEYSGNMSGNVIWNAGVATFKTGGSYAAVQTGTNQQVGFYTATAPGGPWTQVDTIAATGNDLVLTSINGGVKAKDVDGNTYRTESLRQVISPRAQTISSLTGQNITGLSASVVSGTYIVTGRFWLKWNAGAGQPGMLFTGPTISQYDVVCTSKQQNSSAVTNIANSLAANTVNGQGYNSSALNLTVAMTGAGANFLIDFWGMFAFTASGTLNLQGATTVSVADTWIVEGGFWEVKPV